MDSDAHTFGVRIKTAALAVIACAGIFGAEPALPQSARYQTGARYTTGNLARLEAEKALFHPGVLRYTDAIVLDTFIARLYGLKDLDMRSGFLIVPRKNARIGVSATSFGGKKYAETGAGLVYFQPLTDAVAVCAEARWLSVSIQGYSSKADYSLDAGVFLRRSRIHLGLRALNALSRGNAHTGAGSVPGFQIAGGARLSPLFQTSFGVLKQRDYQPLWAMENRMAIGQALAVVFGVTLHPAAYSIGAEIAHNNLRFAYYIKNHPDLGATSRAGVSILFNAHER